MPTMTDEQVYEFIREKWETGKYTWDTVAKELEKKGHVSPRTHRPLVGGACRSIYYNFHKKPVLPSQELRVQLQAMKSILNLQTDASTKIKLLEQIIKALD